MMNETPRRTRRAPVLAPLLILTAALAACVDDDDPGTRVSFTVILGASPSNFSLDDLDVFGNGMSTITAIVLDQDGIPLEGVEVIFSTTAGSLDSQGVGQTTAFNGIARDVLTTSESATIDAQSGLASARVNVTVPVQPALPGNVRLTALSPTSGLAPLTVSFQAVVTDTNGDAMQGQILSVTIAGDSLAFPSPLLPVTDAFGIASFDVENIMVDGTQILVSADSVASNLVSVEITG